jgi:XTP/dITP diphosphohydrolase
VASVRIPESVVLATRNPHKLREFARLFAPAGITVEPLPPEVELPPEVGDTFVANALPKARTAAAATGRVAIADDSGIEADALAGRPGVFSARYAGPDATDQENLDKLLAHAPAGSGLRYVCVLVVVDPETAQEEIFMGECRGIVARRVAGQGGFGYDPAFVPSGEPAGLTMAQLSDADKDRISHRGRAVAALLAARERA